MHNICFEISYYLDDAGVPVYVAIHAEDFDENGIPLPDAPRGVGETPMLAVIALCELLDEREAAQHPLHRTRLTASR